MLNEKKKKHLYSQSLSRDADRCLSGGKGKCRQARRGLTSLHFPFPPGNKGRVVSLSKPIVVASGRPNVTRTIHISGWHWRSSRMWVTFVEITACGVATFLWLWCTWKYVKQNVGQGENRTSERTKCSKSDQFKFWIMTPIHLIPWNFDTSWRLTPCASRSVKKNVLC